MQMVTTTGGEDAYAHLMRIELYAEALVAFVTYTNSDGYYLWTEAVTVYYDDLYDDPDTFAMVVTQEDGEAVLEEYDVSVSADDVNVVYTTDTTSGQVSFSRHLADYLPVGECADDEDDEDGGEDTTENDDP